ADAGATRRRGKTRTYAVGRVLAVGRARNLNAGILALARAAFAAPRQCDDAAGRAVHDSLRSVSDCGPKPRDLAGRGLPGDGKRYLPGRSGPGPGRAAAGRNGDSRRRVWRGAGDGSGHLPHSADVRHDRGRPTNEITGLAEPCSWL